MTTFPDDKPTHTKRLDIQGLRALAVILVVLEHAFAVPRGGFIGVDVFFVLSGFLMTSILYREFDKTGRIKFLAFYRRRIRRLIPAATATIVATVIAAYFLFASGRFTATLWDGLSAFGFVSNWRYAALQTDYFNQGSAASPLQHFWSLSVEEQYYLVWPFALLCLCVVAYRSTMRRAIVGILTVALTLLMFALAFSLTNSNPDSAYFITPARIWELSLGGVIALSMPLFDKVGQRIRPFLMLLGLAGILAAAFVTPSGAGFPAPWAGLAVLSTALILAFPWHPAKHGAWNPLTNPVAGFVGDISYSFYLWHFPAIILIAEAFRGLPGEGTLIPPAIAVVASFGIAVLSYRYIEEPVRKSQWLEPDRRRTDRSRRAYRYVGLGALSALTVVSVVAAIAFNRSDPATAQNAAGGSTANTSTPVPTDAPPGAAVSELQTQLAAALKATSWPQLQQDPGDPKDIDPDPRMDQCSSFKYKQEDCLWGSDTATKTAVVLGDSIAAAYLPGLTQVFGQGDWKMVAAPLYACPFIDMRLGASAQQADYCEQRRQTEVDLVNSVKPDVVILSNTYFRNNKADTGKKPTIAAWMDAFDAQLTKIDGSYKKLVYLPPPPYDANIEECYSPRTSPAECISKVSKSDYSTSMKGVKQVVAKHNGEFVDNADWFCVDGKCPAFMGNTLTKKDLAHPINTYVLALVPVMMEDLLAAAESAEATPEAEAPATGDAGTDDAGTDGSTTDPPTEPDAG